MSGSISSIGAMALTFLLGFWPVGIHRVDVTVMRPLWRTPVTPLSMRSLLSSAATPVALLITNRVFLAG